MSSSYPGYGSPTMQRCQRCGMPLSPNAGGYCGNCGMQNVPSQPQQSSASGQLPFGSSVGWGGQSQAVPGNGQAGQFGQFGGPQASQPLSTFQQPFGPRQSFNAPSAPLQPSGNGYQQQPFGTQGQFSSPGSFASVAGSPPQPNAPFAPQSQQPLYQQPLPGNNFQMGNMNGYHNRGDFEDPDFSNGRKKPKLGLIIGSILLLLLLVGGGIGGYMILKSHKSQTTALTQSTTPTATPKGPPLFSDSFQNNNKGWDLTGKAGEYSVAISGGSLALEDDNNRLLWELLPGGKTYDNFLLNVDAVLSKGSQDNGYGIYIRGASNQAVDIATYYRFELYGDGSFAIFKGTLDASGTSQSSNLVSNTGSSAIVKQGQVNHISIVASRSTMSFIVNGLTLKTFTDNSYTSGSIALFVSNLANAPAGAQAKFSNLVIYPPQ